MDTFVNWDFASVWMIDENINNGYPYLRFISPAPESVTITAEKSTLYVGDAIQLVANIHPENAPGIVAWSSSDTSVLTITKTGYLTAVKEGVATITVRTGNVSQTKSFTVLQQQTNGNIVAVDEIYDVTLENTATYEDALRVLPSSVTVSLSNGSKASLPVEWSLVENSKYDFVGNIVLSSDSPITNTNNIKAEMSVIILDKPSEIASAEELKLSVPFATGIDSVLALLPVTVKVTLENSKEYDLFVKWSEESEPYFRSTTEGDYVFTGELILPESGLVLNATNKVAKATVTVEAQPETERKITAIVAPEGITVPYNTPLSDVKAMLPTSVFAVFDNIETLPVDVVWSNNSTPAYELKASGVYTFTGTITTTGAGMVTNPYNLQATINVTVDKAPVGGRNIYVSEAVGIIGQTVDIKVDFDSDTTMASGSFVIDYNPEKLSPIGYKIGTGIELASVMVNTNYTDPSDGLKKVKVSFMASEELNIGGNAITVTFKLNDTCENDEKLDVSIKSLTVCDMNENMLSFEIYNGCITATNILIGDVNGDGEINIFDAFRIVRFDAGFVTLTDRQKKAADVDENEEIDIFDAMNIQRFDIGLSTSFK